MKPVFLAVLSALVLVVQSAYAMAEKRLALVVGISAYRTVPELKNPRNDATDIAEKLRGLGFDVIEGYDLDREALSAKIREFAKSMAGADTALFYYAGHGLQVNGANYLAAADTNLKDASDLDFELVPLDLVTKQMEHAQAEKTLKVGLVFLDACRDNPMARSLKVASRAITSGLARMGDASGMLIAYATQPNNVALDGVGRNSPFTKAVIANIDKSGLSISDMMINVRNEVMTETNGKQVPWDSSSLTDKFYFNPGDLVTAEAPKQPEPVIQKQEVLTVADATLDLTFWKSVESSSNPEMFKAYLEKFPKGIFARVAETKLAEFSQQRAIAVEETTSTPQQPIAQQSNPALQQAQNGPMAPQQNTKVASLGNPTEHATDRQEAAPISVTNPFEAATLLQGELARLGCYRGSIDGQWGRGSRTAMRRFNEQANTAYMIEVPTVEAINALRQIQTQVCQVAQEVRIVETPRPIVRERVVVRHKQRWQRQPRFHGGNIRINIPRFGGIGIGF